MAVDINDTPNRVRYTATAGQTAFSVPFQFPASSDLKVYQNGTLKTLATHYTVTGAGAASGTVTLVTGATLSDDILIIRDLPVERIGDFPVSGPFDVESLNRQLDAQTMMVRDLETRIERRLLRQPVTDLPETLSDLPAKAARANLYLGFDANGQPKAEMPNAAELVSLDGRVDTLETVSGGLPAVNTVAANIASVNTASSNIAGINNVSAAITNGDLLTDVYQGARASNPTLRLDSQPLQSGDFYFNTGSSRFRTYSGGSWYDMTSDGATTAALVSYTTQAGPASNANVQLNEAETSSQLINLELRKARRCFKKLFDSASSTQQLKLASLGDSLKDRQNVMFIWSLDRKMGGVSPGFVNYDNTNVRGTSGGDVYYTDQVNTTGSATSFDVVSSGSLVTIADGGSIRLIDGGVNLTYTTLKIFYIKESGAGTLNITNAGSTVASASAADATTQLGILTHTKTLGQVVTTITATGGPVRVWFGHYVNGRAGVDFWASLGAGGITPTQMLQTATSRAILQAALTEIGPDLVTFSIDDDFGAGAYDTALSQLFTVLDNGAPIADKLFIGPQPRASSDSTRKLSNERLRREISTRGGPYLFYDTYRIMGTYAEMTAALGSDDGVHSSPVCAALGAAAIFQVLGLDTDLAGFSSAPIKTPDIASRLFRETVIQGGASEIKFSTDATFGYDWTITVNRMLTLNANASTVWQFSGNTGVFPNIVPANFKWNSAASTQSLIGNTNGSYFKSIDFVDSDTTKGYGITRHEYVTFASYTKAQLPPANVRTPSVIYCSDAAASGGGCFLYSMGDFYWRRISDDAQVIP